MEYFGHETKMFQFCPFLVIVFNIAVMVRKGVLTHIPHLYDVGGTYLALGGKLDCY